MSLWMPGIHKIKGVKDSLHLLEEIAQASSSRTRGKRHGGIRDKWDILRAFIHVTQKGVRTLVEGKEAVSSLQAYDEYGRTGTFFSNKEEGDEWLQIFCTLKTSPFVPAGWGIRVLEILEMGGDKVILWPTGKVVLEVGVDINGKFFNLRDKRLPLPPRNT